MRNTKLLKFLGTLNLLPCLFEFVWAMFVILIYANPSVPSIVLSAGFLGNERGTFQFFESFDKFMLICNALRIIALIYVFFSLRR